MIEEWLIKFVMCCFAVMWLAALSLHMMEQIGQDYIENSDENGEKE